MPINPSSQLQYTHLTIFQKTQITYILLNIYMDAFFNCVLEIAQNIWQKYIFQLSQKVSIAKIIIILFITSQYIILYMREIGDDWGLSEANWALRFSLASRAPYTYLCLSIPCIIPEKVGSLSYNKKGLNYWGWKGFKNANEVSCFLFFFR